MGRWATAKAACWTTPWWPRWRRQPARRPLRCGLLWSSQCACIVLIPHTATRVACTCRLPALPSHGNSHPVPQVLLRWNVQRGVPVIPKAGSEPHLRSNIEGLFGWRLTQEQQVCGVPVEGLRWTCRVGRDDQQEQEVSARLPNAFLWLQCCVASHCQPPPLPAAGQAGCTGQPHALCEQQLARLGGRWGAAHMTLPLWFCFSCHQSCLYMAQ